MNKKIILLVALTTVAIVNSQAATQVNSEKDLGESLLNLLQTVEISNPKLVEPICDYIGLVKTELDLLKNDSDALGKKIKEVVNPEIFGLSKFLSLTAKLNREKKIDNFSALFKLKEKFNAIEKYLIAK